MIMKRTVFFLSLVLFVLSLAARAQGIHEAARKGDFATIKTLIEKGPGVVSLKDDRGVTPLHLAAEGGFMDIAEWLIGKGAEVDARDMNGNTPLHYAARSAKAEAAELLLARGAAVDSQNKDGFAALHLAAMNRHKPLVRLFVEKGAKIDLRENRGATPLIVVIWRMGDLDLVRLLIERGADINARIEGSWVTPLAMAAQYGHREIVDLLLDKGALVDEKSRQQVLFAASHGLDRMFRILAERGADMNTGTNNGGTLIHLAAQGGSAAILGILLEKGLRPDDPDRYGWTPLHHAGYYGKKTALEYLIGKGAGIDRTTFSGKTAFNIASEKGYRDAAEFLASKGADRSPQKFPALEGEYLGQKRPGDAPEVFALDIVSSPGAEHGNATFSPDGKTMYWTGEYVRAPGQGSFKVYSSRLEEGRWTKPEFASFTGDVDVNDDAPFAAPDGKRLFFHSLRPVSATVKAEKENIWITDRTATGWSRPEPLSAAVNAMTIRWQSSVARGGNLYFGSTDAGGRGASDIYVSRLIGGEYAKPENLGEPVNTEFSETAPFVAPDESYLIFGRDGQKGQPWINGLHISFRGADGKWSKPVNMGEAINSGGAGHACVSPDGNYLFFNSGRNGNYDIYWVSAKTIEKLRAAGK